MDPWYYRIELPGGQFTNGRPRANLALCRPLLARIEKTGLRCLDIGTQEFVAPVLFHRQGAGEIVAYDVLNLEARRRVVVSAYGTPFHYAAGLPLIGLKQYLRNSRIDTRFDFVNFCGVLYHLPDPLTGLAVARSFLREGGLMLLETSCALDAGCLARVNSRGELYPGSNFFQVSLDALDYWARMLRMRVLDAAFTGVANGIARVAMVCRAVDRPQPEPGDTWMGKEFVERALAPYGLDYSELASSAPPPEYRGASRGVVRPGVDSIDLYQTFRRHGTTPIDDALSCLRLADAA